MKLHKNPYKQGGACYLAYEQGYYDAIEDAEKIDEVTGIGNHEEKRTAGRAAEGGKCAGGLQHQRDEADSAAEV